MTINFSQTAAFIWSVADLLRGDFKQSQYGRIILPFNWCKYRKGSCSAKFDGHHLHQSTPQPHQANRGQS